MKLNLQPTMLSVLTHFPCAFARNVYSIVIRSCALHIKIIKLDRLIALFKYFQCPYLMLFFVWEILINECSNLLFSLLCLCVEVHIIHYTNLGKACWILTCGYTHVTTTWIKISNFLINLPPSCNECSKLWLNDGYISPLILLDFASYNLKLCLDVYHIYAYL